jgi:cytochrome oxidase Cu insertion factor (SCO1/SenC/PrrC family)
MLHPLKLKLLLVAAMLAAAPGVAIAGAAANLYRLPQTFTDDTGGKVQLRAWSGRPAIVAMEYSNCRFMCSITLLRLQAVQAAADRLGRKFDFIIVSLDPKNDTPAAWVQYRRNRDLLRANWHFLTGSEADTPRLARILGVNYWYYDEHLLHDFRLLRLDSQGNVIRVMDSYDADPAQFIE